MTVLAVVDRRSNGNLAGIPRLSLLLIVYAVPFFVLPFAAESLLRLHDDR
jgi:hypothetical protein